MSNNADEQELTPMNTLPAMKREIVAILSLTLLAVVGCNDVIHTDAVLINNVGREVTFRWRDREPVTTKQGNSAVFRDAFSETGTWSVRSSVYEWIYSIPPDIVAGLPAFGHRYVYLQVERDGLVYQVDREPIRGKVQPPPARNLEPFPLRPSQTIEGDGK